MSTAEFPLLLTTRQAAKELQISERTIFNLLASGVLPSVKIGAARRIPTEGLKAFAQSGVAEIA